MIRTRSLDPLHLPTWTGRATHALPTSGEKGGRLFGLLGALLVPDSKVGWLPFALRAAVRAHRKRPFDAILATGPPHSSLVGAAWLSRRLGLPLVLDFRDDWLDAPRQTFATSVHRSVHGWLERWTIGRARDVWTVSEPIAQSIRSRSETKPCVIPHGYDDPLDTASVPCKDRDRPMRVLYAGVFYGAQQPLTFLLALRRVLDKTSKPNVIAVFAGLLSSDFQQRVAQLDLSDHVEVLSYLTAHEASQHMRTADMLWMTVGHQKQARQIVTSKLYAYFGARRPILGLVPEGAARDQLERYGASRIADPDDVAAAADHLLAFYDDWTHRRLPTPDSAFVDALEGRAIAARAAARLDLLLGDSNG